MKKFKTLKAEFKGEVKVLYDGKEFMNFNWLHGILGERYDDINDDLMDGICDSQIGEWNEDHTEWSWGMFINDDYITFTFEPETFYTLKDWDGSVIFERCTLDEIKKYFEMSSDVKDLYDVREELNRKYEGMKNPEIEEC